jgi:CRISPR-associated protein Csb2
MWAFSGLALSTRHMSLPDAVLIAATDNSMLRNYEREDVRWRTVTPAALPEVAKRRRIDPARRGPEGKTGAERGAEQQRAAREVIQALRHAELPTAVEMIRVQREPFEANGERVEAFAPGTRFQKERLWHVEITFNERVPGPLLIGDGRYYGLGLMAPFRSW